MKNVYLILFIVFFTTSLCAQSIATFEELELPLDTFLNNAGETSGYMSGEAFFPNTYNLDYGGFWESGWAISSSRNDSLGDFNNLYGAIIGSGFESTTYAIGQQNAIIRLEDDSRGKIVNGVYLTNGTYPYISMSNGDDFAKKFGGDDGTDSDFFKIEIRKFSNGELSTNLVEFYLADFRFENDSLDYIVNDWQWVDLTSLGNVDSLQFTLSSSDVGNYGINTPLFFCLDNLEISNEISTSIAEKLINNIELKIFPNPTVDKINVVLNKDQSIETLTIFDIMGRQILNQSIEYTNHQISVTHLNKGVYYLTAETKNGVTLSTTFVKKKQF